MQEENINRIDPDQIGEDILNDDFIDDNKKNLGFARSNIQNLGYSIRMGWEKEKNIIGGFFEKYGPIRGLARALINLMAYAISFPVQIIRLSFAPIKYVDAEFKNSNSEKMNEESVKKVTEENSVRDENTYENENLEEKESVNIDDKDGLYNFDINHNIIAFQSIPYTIDFNNDDNEPLYDNDNNSITLGIRNDLSFKIMTECSINDSLQTNHPDLNDILHTYPLDEEKIKDTAVPVVDEIVFFARLKTALFFSQLKMKEGFIENNNRVELEKFTFNDKNYFLSISNDKNFILSDEDNNRINLLTTENNDLYKWVKENNPQMITIQEIKDIISEEVAKEQNNDEKEFEQIESEVKENEENLGKSNPFRAQELPKDVEIIINGINDKGDVDMDNEGYEQEEESSFNVSADVELDDDEQEL